MDVWPLDSVLGHTGAKRARIKPENTGGPTWPADSPVEIFKYADYIFALHVVEGLNGSGQDFRFANAKVFLDSKHVTTQIYNCTLDDIGQLANVAGPGVRPKCV